MTRERQWKSGKVGLGKGGGRSKSEREQIGSAEGQTASTLGNGQTKMGLNSEGGEGGDRRSPHKKSQEERNAQGLGKRERGRRLRKGNEITEKKEARSKRGEPKKDSLRWATKNLR